MAVSAWIKAARLRTLPLTLVCIGTGTAVAIIYRSYGFMSFWDCCDLLDYTTLGLTVLTALLLQILSNFANDYGDFVKGTDNHDRVGPQRALQSGAITQAQMKVALWILGTAALISGLALLNHAFDSLTEWLIFLGLGLLSILAAITYTVGKNAYGYKGLGDIMVFVFFGLTGVYGTFYLQIKQLDFLALLPAISVGFFSTGVLNMNNLRDTENDRASGKITIPVRIGVTATKVYQTLLVVLGLGFTGYYFTRLHIAQLLVWFAPAALLFAVHIVLVWINTEFRKFDAQLKLCVLSTLVYGITFVALSPTALRAAQFWMLPNPSVLN